MKLADIKDENGTSLQTFADMLVEKTQRAGLQLVLILAQEPDFLHLLSNVPVEALPDVLSQLAAQMRKHPKTREKRTDLQNPTEKN